MGRNAGRTFDFERITAEEARREYPELWNTAQSVLPQLSESDLAIVVSLVRGTCPYCYEAERGCQCWNDE